jgi:RNA polymerase sigma-70 factor (ECF subfamily)
VDLYQPLVRTWCHRCGLQNADTDDVTQEVFAAAAANLDRFHHDQPGDTFRGWLRIITRNQINLHFRRLQDRPLAAGGSDAWHDLQQVANRFEHTPESDSAEISELYRRALEQVRGDFEEPTWQAFWLTAIEDRSPAALAEELQMTPAAIRQAKSRVLRRLKQEMGELLV